MIRIVTVTVLIALMSSAAADSWAPAQPIAAVSENAEWLVRVEPGESIGDVYGFAGAPEGEYAEATLYKFDDDLENYSEVGKYRTRNPVAPVEIHVSNSGWLVTLDNWHNLGIGTVIASYDSDGVLVRELNLADIFESEDLKKLEQSVSSIWWRCGPTVLDSYGTSIGIWDTLGRDVSINYVDGTVRVGGETGVCLDNDEPDTSWGRTDLPFAIQQVELGTTEQDMLDNLGEPTSREQKPPQFGEVEIGYEYPGLYVHVTDGVVFGFWLTAGPFKYDNGIAIGMTKADVEKVLGKSYSMPNINLGLGDSDCFANLSFTEGRLSRVFHGCDG